MPSSIVLLYQLNIYTNNFILKQQIDPKAININPDCSQPCVSYKLCAIVPLVYLNEALWIFLN